MPQYMLLLRDEPTVFALSRYHFLPATLGELWSELGDKKRASAYYRSALAYACTEPERRRLQKRLGECEAT